MTLGMDDERSIDEAVNRLASHTKQAALENLRYALIGDRIKVTAVLEILVKDEGLEPSLTWRSE